MSEQMIRPAPVKKSVVVRAPPETAFRVFTQGFDRWWPKAYHIGASTPARTVLEPRAGGRWHEVGEDGAECDWGEVQAWEPPSRLLLVWRISTQWRFDAAAHSEVEVLFTPLPDGGTRVDLEHRGLEGLGAGAEALRERFESPAGWGAILAAFQAASDA